MRILFMNQKLGYAGNTSYSLDLALALKQAGREVRVCTTGGPLREVFTRHGLSSYVVKFNMLSYWKLIEYLREFRPQLLHIQNRQSAVFGQKFSKKLRIPHVITVHRVPDSIWPSLAHPQLAGVIAVNEVIREFLVNDQGLPKTLIRVIPRGVNVDELVPESGRKVLGPEGNWIPVLGSVGSLTKLKGHHFFVKAARRVLDHGIEAMFAIVGEGPEEKPLRRLVQKLQLEKHVMFSPHIPDRQELYRVFDIVVVPTLRGGIGSTALEAMAMGKPIIASAVGEILHIVQDEQTGLLVPQGDAEALADRMIRLLTTPDLPETLGRAARERVEQKFALDRMIQGTLGFYDEVVGKLHEGGLTAAL